MACQDYDSCLIVVNLVPFALVFSAKTLFLPLSLTAAVKEGNAADKIQEAILKMLDLKTIGNLSVLSVIIKGKLCIVMFYTLRENPEGGGGGRGGVSVHRLQVFPTHSFSFVLKQSHFQIFFKCYST